MGLSRNRAEATDVANAVLDGVDGMLLGAETLRGKYPVETVSTVLSICRQAEQIFNHKCGFTLGFWAGFRAYVQIYFVY